MRYLFFSLALLQLAGCATFDRLRGGAEEEGAEETTQPSATSDPAAPAPYGQTEYPATPPSTGVVVPPSDRTTASPATPDVARPPVQSGMDGDQSAKGGTYPNAPSTPRAYGTTATTPTPYGRPDSDPYPAPATAPAKDTMPNGATAGVVQPHTTIVATPSAYEHVNADADRTVDPEFAAALTGLWVNKEDTEETVEFTTDHYTTFYEGELLVQEPMTVHKRCPGDCNGGIPMDIGCFTIVGPAGIDCFGIVRLTSTELELKLLGVSEETVTYRRK